MIGAKLWPSMATIVAATVLSTGADRAAASPASVATFTAVEKAAFPAVARPVARNLPKQIREFGDRPWVKARWGGANPRDARAVTAPDGSTRQPWYLVPARRGICLLRLGAGTCQTFDAALRGLLYLQTIQPYGNSKASPLPPTGTPFASRVVGLAPAGVTGVDASTTSGQSISGLVKDGMFSVSGTGITSYTLTREASAVPVFAG